MIGAVEQFTRRGIRLELADGDNVRAIGTLNDSLRAAIKTQKPQIVDELRWREFEGLLATVAPAYSTPALEYAEIRQVAAGHLTAAIEAYRIMAKQIKGVRAWQKK